jgi:hypothetical protein
MLLLLAGCRGGGERGRAAGSAAWMDAAASPLAVADLARLEAGDVGELFVEAASLDWQGGQPQVAPLQLPRAPRRVHATLVLRGAWPSAPVDASTTARALATALGAVARRAEESALGVAGWHLDLQGVPGKDGAELAAALREELEPSLLLSATLPRDALAAEGVEDLTDATDFVVAFLYGVREGEVDDPSAWDFQRVKAGAQRLDELAEPFLVGVVVRGVATLVRGGSAVEEIAGATLAELAWNRKLRVRHGFSLEGLDRQVYTFTADVPTRVAETRLAAGDDVRVVGTSTAHVQELRRQIAGWKLEHCLGALYYRLPRPGEALTLDAANLARAGGEAPALPVPRVTVTRLGTATGRVTVAVLLENASSEGSDMGHLDSNYVELWAQGGAFGRVEQGQFYRFDVYQVQPNGQLARTFRNPTLLRFYAPLLPAGAHIESGPIEIRTVRAGLTDLLVRATFLAPYGGTAEMKPMSWNQLQPAPTPTPTPQPKPARRR